MHKIKRIELINIGTHSNTVYEPEPNQVSVIVGNNLDNRGQKGNGSGKSYLGSEALSLGFLGDTIRKIRAKEVIKDGAKSGSVKIEWYNTISNLHYTVLRQFHKTGSGEVNIWKGPEGEEEELSKLATVDIRNKWLLDELEISEQDLYDNYFITKEHFQPFLGLTDMKKKEVVNRFSKADAVDQVEAPIKKDSKLKQDQIDQQKVLLTKEETRKELYITQLDEKRQSVKKEEIESEIQEFKDFIDDNESLIDTAEKEKNASIRDLQTSKDSLVEKQSDLQKTEEEIKQEKLKLEPYQKDIELIEDQQDSLDEKQTEVEVSHREKRAIIAQNEKDLQVLADKEIKSLIQKKDFQLVQNKQGLQVEENKLKELKAELQTSEQYKTDLQNKLAGLIECPSCSHKFSLADKEFSFEEGTAELEGIILVIGEVNNDIALQEDSIEGLKTVHNDIVLLFDSDIKKVRLELEEALKLEAEKDKDILSKLGKEVSLIEKEKEAKVVEYKAAVLKKKEAYKSVDVLVAKTADILQEIMTLERAINDHEINIKRYEALVEGYVKHIAEAKEEIKELEAKMEFDDKPYLLQIKEAEKKCLDIKEGVEKLEKERADIEAWLGHFKAFKSSLANQSIKDIQDYTNMNLQLIGSDIQIEIDGYKTDSRGKLKEEISVTVLRDGFDEGSYGRFSAGERARIDICCLKALAGLINLNCERGGLDWMGLDEIIDSVDPYGLQLIVEGMKNMQGTIHLISQHHLNGLIDQTILVEKQNKNSRIIKQPIYDTATGCFRSRGTK